MPFPSIVSHKEPRRKFSVSSLWINAPLLTVLLITCAVTFTSVMFLMHLASEEEEDARATVGYGIRTFWTFLNAKGDIRIHDGRLMAGDYVLNGHSDIPNDVRNIFGGTATIFMGDVPVSASTGLEVNGKPVGMKLTGAAYDAVLQGNKYFNGETSIEGIPYITAYDPIRDRNGFPIGAICVGLRKNDFHSNYQERQKEIIATGVCVNILFVALSFALLWQRKKYVDILNVSESTYRTLFESSNEGIVLTKERIVACNDRVCDLLGLPRGDIIGSRTEEIFPPFNADVSSFTEGTHSCSFRRKDGKLLNIEYSVKAVEVAGGRATQVMMRDVSQQQLATMLLSAEKEMMEMIVQERPLLDVLSHICLTFEKLCNETLCSVLLVDTDGKRLVEGAAPTLPAEYTKAVSGTRIGPSIGACGTAAFTGKRVICGDISTDPHWQKYKELPLRYGLRACWSNPILSSDNRVLGTFAIYYGTAREPELYELNLIDRASALASIAIQQTRAREALHDAFFKQQAILDNIPDMIWMKDVEGRFLIVNEAFAQKAGFNSHDIVGKTDLDVWPPDLANRYRADDFEVVETGRRTCIEEPLQDNDGSRRWIETIKTPVYRPNSTIMGTTGIARDIDVRKRAEAALMESEERFHQFFTQNWDAVMLLSKGNLHVVDVNPAMIQLFGYELSELQRLGPFCLSSPDSTQAFLDFFPNVAEKVDSILDHVEAINRDGKNIAVSVRARLIRIKDESIVYCSFRDISERIRLEAEQREAQAKLIQANKMTSLGMLVSGIAHEINNPNQYISVNASLLADIWQDAVPILGDHQAEHGQFHLKGLPFEQIRETTPRLFRGIEEGSRRINIIVQNLKEFARDNSGQKHVLFDLNGVVSAAVMILTHQIHLHTDNFRLELAEELPRIKGKPQLIEQVVINLLTNALEALPHKKAGVVVSSSLDTESGHIYLKVRDDGKGMTKAVMERITEPFFSTRLNEGGTGLGLSISATILKEHEATLTYESFPGEGTTAIVKFKAADAE